MSDLTVNNSQCSKLVSSNAPKNRFEYIRPRAYCIAAAGRITTDSNSIFIKGGVALSQAIVGVIAITADVVINILAVVFLNFGILLANLSYKYFGNKVVAAQELPAALTPPQKAQSAPASPRRQDILPRAIAATNVLTEALLQGEKAIQKEKTIQKDVKEEIDKLKKFLSDGEQLSQEELSSISNRIDELEGVLTEQQGRLPLAREKEVLSFEIAIKALEGVIQQRLVIDTHLRSIKQEKLQHSRIFIDEALRKINQSIEKVSFLKEVINRSKVIATPERVQKFKGFLEKEEKILHNRSKVLENLKQKISSISSNKVEEAGATPSDKTRDGLFYRVSGFATKALGVALLAGASIVACSNISNFEEVLF